MSFVELRAQSAFSFGKGAATPEALIQCAVEYGYPALGLTDTADMGGVVRFAQEAQQRSIQPVIGAELRVDGYPAAFLVQDEEGYRNLAALVTLARAGTWDGWQTRESVARRGQPEVFWAQVRERSAGLFALTGPPAGEIPSLLRTRRPDEAARALRRWRDVFGERLAIEAQIHNAGSDEAELVAALIGLSRQSGVPWVACQNPCYVDQDGRLVHDALSAIRAGTTLMDAADRGALRPNGEWRLRARWEVQQLWRGQEQGLEQSWQIASRCGFDLSWVRPPLPSFPVPGRSDEDCWLRKQVHAGAQERWGSITPEQNHQLEHELGVIQKLGFAGFFLVMWDAVQFCRSEGILAQGRGSAANSAVAFCLGISAVDPVRHGLLFERFLSEVRVGGATEAPDIDIDIEHERRERVLDYMYGRYWRSHSAITCTVQTYRAPSALQDAMRALGYPPPQSRLLSKRIHHQEPAEGAAYLEAELAKRFDLELGDARGRTLLRIMRAMDGLPRMRSTHVGGFVLSGAPLGEHMPIEPTTMGRTIIQFDKDDLDAVGVPKFDFLGLGALSLVRKAFDAVEIKTGIRPEMYSLPPDDPVTYDLISRGQTVGMFQIESRAQIASILHTKPDRIYDLVVQVALIRPGPIQARFVHPYTARRRGLEEVRYPHPDLEPILQRTQGIPIFQEQAMRIGMVLGGFSAAEADQLRRTMGHQRKLPRLLGALQQLRDRMVGRGIDECVAAQIVDDLRSFANYGFPESHAWSFALISYATAWLKAHHPTEFYLGLLNSWPMGFYPPSTLVHEARRLGLEVRPPCLRDGKWDCTTEPSASSPHPALRIGWRFIRGVGERTRTALQSAYADRPFESVEDVIARAGLGRAEALHLARAGAFEAWEPGRRRAAWEALRIAGDTLPLAPARHVPFALQEPQQNELIFLDYLATGICAHGHPVQHLRERLRAAGVTDSKALERCRPGHQVIVAGLVVIRQRPQSAKGTIFLLLEDEYGFINVVVARSVADAYGEEVRFAPFVAAEGRFERDGAVVNVIARRFHRLEVREVAFHSRNFR